MVGSGLVLDFCWCLDFLVWIFLCLLYVLIFI